LIQPPARSAVGAWSRLFENHYADKRENLLRSAIAEIRKNSQRHNFEQLIEHRDATSLAGRRKLRDAERQYKKLKRSS